MDSKFEILNERELMETEGGGLLEAIGAGIAAVGAFFMGLYNGYNDTIEKKPETEFIYVEAIPIDQWF